MNEQRAVTVQKSIALDGGCSFGQKLAMLTDQTSQFDRPPIALHTPGHFAQKTSNGGKRYYMCCAAMQRIPKTFLEF